MVYQFSVHILRILFFHLRNRILSRGDFLLRLNMAVKKCEGNLRQLESIRILKNVL